MSEAFEGDPSKYGLSEDASFGKEAYSIVDEVMYNVMRADILNEDKRIGGRRLDEVCPIEVEVVISLTNHTVHLFLLVEKLRLWQPSPEKLVSK